ncbi:MAG: type II toxin-antitoxin system VapC family toxin [Parafilimonas sp.]
MANELILIDTSVMIDYYRKTDKANSVLIKLLRQGNTFAVSAITKYEIYSGATQNQIFFWNQVFEGIRVFAFDEVDVDMAVEINTVLKRKRKQIDIADLFIAATAVRNNLSLAIK